MIESKNASKECQISLNETLIAFNNLEDWAFELINSWGKFPPSGLMSGSLNDFGDYFQCLSITPNEVIGESQYCLIELSVPVPKPMRVHQNFYHEVDVLPHFVNKSGNNIFVKLSRDASFFYWYGIKLGICTPNKCTKSHIESMAKNS